MKGSKLLTIDAVLAAPPDNSWNTVRLHFEGYDIDVYSGPDSWTAVPDPIGNPGRLESLCVRLPPLYHAASLNPPSCEPIPKWYQLAGVA